MKYPLMRNNILREDLEAVIEHLKQEDPILTNGPNVRAFEAEWSQWLGVKYSVFVNSGASANLLSMAILKIRHPNGGEVITPPLTWVSDVASVLQNGFTPVFADIDPCSLAMHPDEILKKIVTLTNGKVPVIASGGIFAGTDAEDKFNHGAALVQVWTGFIYEGPGIVNKICKALK